MSFLEFISLAIVVDHSQVEHQRYMNFDVFDDTTLSRQC